VDAALPMLFVASYSYNKTRANTHATVIKLSFGCFLKLQTVQILPVFVDQVTFHCRRHSNSCTLLTRQSTFTIKGGCGVCVASV